MKNVVLIVILLAYSSSFYGQTLVRYGNKTISRDEFLSAFRKNNNNTRPTDKTYRDYLNLYIRYRLKVQAALDKKLDTLANQLTELQNFKSQIADQYTNDEVSLNRLAEEAFNRSRYDLRISYIFVAAPKNASPSDTAKAWKKILDAYQLLKNNVDFGTVASQYSEDPSAKKNQGDIGFITVFDLPYIMESIAYQTVLGKYSAVFRIEGGYVILKKTAQRPGKGRIHIAQILVAYPYQASDEAKVETRHRADSIYKAIQSGADFGNLARKFSGDNLSYQLGGVLPEFGIGKYEAGFEEVAFGLKKDGEVSEPYATSFGYHIIKRISRKPVPAKAGKKTIDELKEKIKGDPRAAVSRKQMLQTILKETGFREFIPMGNVLWDYTDSILLNKKPVSGSGISDQSVLFLISDKKYSVGDWITYRRSLKSAPNLIAGKTNPEILDMYKQVIAFQYYRDHLEKYNASFAAQVNEFRDGNLLFEIMQEQIWNPASADSAGLIKYFETNKQKYRWKPGAAAIIFNAPNLTTSSKFVGSLGNNINNWRDKLAVGGTTIQADSARFEWKQIPGHRSTNLSGRFTDYFHDSSPDKKNSSIQFAYIIRIYPVSSPRTFEEARGLVINDYQSELENKWIVLLEKKYPVTIYENVFKTLPK
jgi:peptidyl-prolyl cis-trans isomerase SurA